MNVSIKPSATFKFSDLAKSMNAIDLTIGRPGFDTPQKIKDGCIKALKEGKVHYTKVVGIPELRDVISEKLETENGLNIPSEQIVVTLGAKYALFESILAITEKNDKIAITNPAWVSYEQMIRIAGCIPVFLPLNRNFVPNEDFLNELENGNFKALILNSPNNPTGSVYPEKILRKIADVAESKQILVISDEIYEKFIYDGKHFSIGSVLGDLAITVNGFSKTYSMTGWRLGYVAARKDIIESIANIQSHSTSCVTSFAQWGALTALKHGEKDSERMISDFGKRRDFLVKKMKDIDLEFPPLNGAFYAFPNFKPFEEMRIEREVNDLLRDMEIKNPTLSEIVCLYLLKKAGVGTIPGSAFGTAGKDCLRISYGNSPVEELKVAMERIEGALE